MTPEEREALLRELRSGFYRQTRQHYAPPPSSPFAKWFPDEPKDDAWSRPPKPKPAPKLCRRLQHEIYVKWFLALTPEEQSSIVGVVHEPKKYILYEATWH